MKDFITAALPWIIIGIAIALLAVNAGKRKKGEKKADDNMSEGMCIGMCIGVALGASGVIDLGLGISLGMLAGMGVDVRAMAGACAAARFECQIFVIISSKGRILL